MFLAKCNFANWYVSCLDKTRKEALSAPSIKVSKRVAQFLSFQKEAQHAALFSLRLYGLSARHDPDRENCDRNLDLDRHFKKIADRDRMFAIVDRDQFTYF